jgi:hypothetical protein
MHMRTANVFGSITLVGFRIGVLGSAIAACSTEAGPPPRPEPGVIYTFPRDGQLDVPLSARVVVTFSDPVMAGAIAPCAGTAANPTGALCLVGPDGPLAVTAEVIGDGRIVQLSAALEEATTYALFARSALAPTATNLPASAPLVRSTTRSTRPRAAAPAVVAINGARRAARVHDPARPAPARPRARRQAERRRPATA